jgi:broad specificity phosphatase PhoE
MKEVFLIRHAQAASGPSKMDRDFFLTDTGVAQAHALGQRLCELKLKPEIIYCSRLSRARQTAQIITEYLQAPLLERLDLIEHGSEVYLSDQSYQQAARKFPLKLQPDGSVRATHHGDKLTWQFTVGGEDLATLHSRARNAWRDILAAHPKDEGQIIIVSHGSFLSALMSEIFGCPLQGVWSFSFPNAAYLRVLLRKCGDETWRPSLAVYAPYTLSEVQQ